MQCNYNSFIQIINFHGLFRNALRCQKTGAFTVQALNTMYVKRAGALTLKRLGYFGGWSDWGGGGP